MWGYYSFCEFDDDCMQDDFDDLYGLSNQVAHYDHAFDLILDVESSHGKLIFFLDTTHFFKKNFDYSSHGWAIN